MNQFVRGLLGGAASVAFGGIGGLFAGNRFVVESRTILWDGAAIPVRYVHGSDTREYDVARAQDMAFDEAGYREANEITPDTR